METFRFPSSALRLSDVRSRQILASPLHTPKQMGISKLISQYSQIRISCIRAEFSFGETCSSTNETHLLKAFPVKAHAQEQQGEAKFQVGKNNDAIWRFLRPFPVIATSIQFSSFIARLAVENPNTFQWSNWSMLAKAFMVFTSLSCANVYATGINQIFDIETDKINKPHLPLCSGEVSMESAWLMVMSFVAISLLTAGTLNSVPFIALIVLLLLVTSSYSIPPLRAKASTFGAPIVNSMLDGSVQFLATFAGGVAALGLPFRMSLPMVFMSIFSSIFFLSMGILKDIPDIEGDKKTNIPTIATIIGARKTLLVALGMLILIHFGGVLVSLIKPEIFKSSIMIPTHILCIIFEIYQAWKMHRANYEALPGRPPFMVAANTGDDDETGEPWAEERWWRPMEEASAKSTSDSP